MNWKTSYYVMYFGIWAGLLCLLIAYAANRTLMYGVGAVLIAAAIVQSRKFYRCPYCDEALPFAFSAPTRCGNCRCSLR